MESMLQSTKRKGGLASGGLRQRPGWVAEKFRRQGAEAWLPDRVTIPRFEKSGWAISPSEGPELLGFLFVSGDYPPRQRLHIPQPEPGVCQEFPGLPPEVLSHVHR